MKARDAVEMLKKYDPEEEIYLEIIGKDMMEILADVHEIKLLDGDHKRICERLDEIDELLRCEVMDDLIYGLFENGEIGDSENAPMGREY